MTVISKPLITAAFAPVALTTEYTAGNGMRTIIDKFTGFNGTLSSVSLTINLVPAAGAAIPANVIVSKSIAAGVTETFPELVGHVLEAGGFIAVQASTGSSIVRRCSGREVT